MFPGAQPPWPGLPGPLSGLARLRLPMLCRMSLEWEEVVVDARHARELGRWWRDALGWVAVDEDDDDYEIRPGPDRLPSILFTSVGEPKVVKNRLHLDFRPDDQNAEVDRLLGLGATRANVGQGDDVSWVVLADPEGNEFCILGGRRS